MDSEAVLGLIPEDLENASGELLKTARSFSQHAHVAAYHNLHRMTLLECFGNFGGLDNQIVVFDEALCAHQHKRQKDGMSGLTGPSHLHFYFLRRSAQGPSLHPLGLLLLLELFFVIVQQLANYGIRVRGDYKYLRARMVKR